MDDKEVDNFVEKLMKRRRERHEYASQLAKNINDVIDNGLSIEETQVDIQMKRCLENEFRKALNG